MNKSAIKNFAVTARVKLMEAIEQKAYELGITKNESKEPEVYKDGFRVNDKFFKKYQMKQRKKLLQKVKDQGFDQVIEEVAYTWFNRFIAIRFMEVNEYLPTGVRVLSSIDHEKIEPDAVLEVLTIANDLELDLEVVYRLQDENNTEELFKYILVKQCNKLGEIMPMMFEQIEDYTELLLPDNLLSEGSVVRNLVTMINEEDWKEEVEIIGWLYQYYISEKKDQVFADLKKNKKITKENIPAATQLFTPKWIVRYMVENSLGRLWLESHPDKEMQTEWKYYLKESCQGLEHKLSDEMVSPEDIKVLDPCMGSGHILVYAFDVLYRIYKKAGYNEREIPKYILEKNLYGLDIDDRAEQLANFAVIMKARSYDRRFFRKKVTTNLISIKESNSIPIETIEYLTDFSSDDFDNPIRKKVKYLSESFKDAKELGSLLSINNIDFEDVEQWIEKLDNLTDIFSFGHNEIIKEKFLPLIKQSKIMSGKYTVTITNPPYMGIGNMNSKLSNYIKNKFPTSKNDLYGVFIEVCFNFTSNLVSMITQHNWMFVMGYENLRRNILENHSIVSLVHLGSNAFSDISGEVVQTCAFVFKKQQNKESSTFIRLVDINSPVIKEEIFINSTIDQNSKYRFNEVNTDSFSAIEGVPIAYWINTNFMEVFKKSTKLKEISAIKTGLSTTDNNRFLRLWYEVLFSNIGFDIPNREEAVKSRRKWFPYVKGGPNNKWYGNRDYVVNWYNDGEEIKEKAKGASGGRIVSTEYYFKPSLTWSYISSDTFAVRLNPIGSIFDSIGTSCFLEDEHLTYYILGLLNSSVSYEMLKILAPTMAFNPGSVGKIPVIFSKNHQVEIENIVKENMCVAINNWNNNETSWDFKVNELLTYDENQISSSVEMEVMKIEENYNKLGRNEEKLNKIFIKIYNLEQDLENITTNEHAMDFKQLRLNQIKKLLSYFVGCILGRYSLDQEGLVYAGEAFDTSKYKTFKVDLDNVIPITDDRYFDNDIVSRFINFISVNFGQDTIEENLDYIADILTKKASETPRQRIRRYFVKEFYKDHLQIYQKHPIYWLFDSGKNDGFKALIYMHRYDIGTVAKIRTDYLHTLQRKYEAEISRLDIIQESDVSTQEKTKAKKQKEKLQKQLLECQQYDQVIAHVANQKIEIDLDDGVKVNYEKFQNIEVPQGEGKKALKANLLAKI